MKIKVRTKGFKEASLELRKIEKTGASRIFDLEVRKKMLVRFEKEFFIMRESYVEKFLNHEITLALLNGGDAGLLKGYGDLASFFGLTGDEAKKDINLVAEAISRSRIFLSTNGKMSIKASFFVPTNKDLFELTPLRWSSGRSWMKAVESGGVAGFGKYLFKKGKYNSPNPSVTGDAIQVKNTIRSGKMTPSSYVTKLLNQFQRDILKII